MVWSHSEPEKSLVGGWWQIKFSVSPGPGLLSRSRFRSGPDWDLIWTGTWTRAWQWGVKVSVTFSINTQFCSREQCYSIWVMHTFTFMDIVANLLVFNFDLYKISCYLTIGLTACQSPRVTEDVGSGLMVTTGAVRWSWPLRSLLCRQKCYYDELCTVLSKTIKISYCPFL